MRLCLLLIANSRLTLVVYLAVHWNYFNHFVVLPLYNHFVVALNGQTHMPSHKLKKSKLLIRSIVVKWLLLLHNFNKESLKSGSALVQILLVACRRFAKVRIPNNGANRKPFAGQPFHKKNSLSSSSSSSLLSLQNLQRFCDKL